MDQVLAEIGKAVGGFFGSPIVQFVLYSILAYLVVLWLASAYWVFRDMQQRTENAILPYLAASLVIVFLPVFPAAVFVYKIIRPHEKIGEVYERNLAEEALLAEVEAIRSCPTCARRVNEDWIICPTCRTRLNRVCPNCSRLVGLDWSLCAWCGKDFERPAAALAASTGRPVPLPALSADESDRVAIRPRAGMDLDDADRRALTNAVPSPRSSRSPRTAAPRTAPDALPEG
jgi:RNA polymerase subunit RPABC4/transcription elongation factor Spt4